MTTMHAAIYSRVSSKRQDTRSQEPDLSNWVMSQNEPVQWYQDKFTGRTMERPGWLKLWREVEAGRVSTIVVWRLDRLGRTAAGLTKLFADLRNRGVNLISLKDGFDLKTPAGRLMATFLPARSMTTNCAQAVLAVSGRRPTARPGAGGQRSAPEGGRAANDHRTMRAGRIAAIAQRPDYRDRRSITS
jgi:hypothetical protein